MEERKLIEGCIRRDRKFQELLYTQLSSKMFGVCLGYAKNTEDAKDILQDSFVKVFETIDQYSGAGCFEGWVRRIFVNTAIDKYRKNVRSVTLNIDLLSDYEEPADDSLLNKIEMDEFLNLIRQLPDGCRLVFNLYAVEGYKHKEIAEMLNISIGTSKSQVHEAKKMLQKKIEKIYAKTNYQHERRVFELVPA